MDAKLVSFVGRNQELTLLRSALDDVFAGRGRTVMLCGEPGIGKTITIAEFVTQAKKRDVLLAQGRCPEHPGAPPFRPWTQSLRNLADQVTPETLHEELGPDITYLAELIPDIPALGSAIPRQVPETPPEQARFRQFDSVATFLHIVSSRRPVLITLDDLHWADESSLELLEFLVPELDRTPVMITGAYRDTDISADDRLTSSLGAISTRQSYTRLPLRSLRRDEVGELIRSMTDVEVSEELVSMVESQSEGNPFFVRELVRMLADEQLIAGADAAGATNWHRAVPDGVRELIGRRLEKLGAECRHILTVAAVIGREFDANLLVRLVPELDKPKLLELLDTALVNRILDDGGQPNHYQYSHALIQHTLLDSLTSVSLTRLHGEVARAVEMEYPNHVEDHVTQLAYHFAQAQPLTGAEPVVRYSLMAGEQALKAFAFKEALDHFEKAATLVDSQVGDRMAAQLSDGLARSLAATGNIPAANRQFVNAFDLYERVGDTERAIAAATYPLAASDTPQSRQMVQRALKLVKPGSPDQAKLLSRMAWFTHETELFERAWNILKVHRDPSQEMWLLGRYGAVEVMKLNADAALEKLNQALQLSVEAKDRHAEVHCHNHAALVHVLNGNISGVEHHAKRIIPAAASTRDNIRMHQAYKTQVMSYLLNGDWTGALQCLDHDLEVMESRVADVLAVRSVIESEMGNPEQAHTALDQAWEILTQDEWPENFLARFGSTIAATYRTAYINRDFALVSRIEPIEEALDRSAGVNDQVPLVDLNRIAVRGLIAAEADKPPNEAQWLYERLRKTGQHCAPDCNYPFRWYVPLAIDRVLGLIAHAVGRKGDAMAHFHAGIHFCKEAGFRPELAWTYHDYAAVLLDTAQFSDRARVASILESASEIAVELGMKALLAQLSDRWAELEMIQSGAARRQYPNGLSEREVDVLGLLATGMSNSQIADELFISANTVARHINHIFQKTGCTNRAGAAAYAHRTGIAR